MFPKHRTKIDQHVFDPFQTCTVFDFLFNFFIFLTQFIKKTMLRTIGLKTRKRHMSNEILKAKISSTTTCTNDKILTKTAIDNAFPSYEKTIQKLNSLQSNASCRAKIIENSKNCSTQNVNVNKFLMLQKSLQFLGLTSKLRDQNVIHITGTKGKGSTAFYLENYLRMRTKELSDSQQLSTGLFTSPHILSVRERIKINGEMVDKATFTKHFWIIYDQLQLLNKNNNNNTNNSLPGYFAFLTLVGLSIFVETKVDVIILEVGIGGRIDSTNIIPNKNISVFTPIHLDHCDILGHSIEEIADQKAGIIRNGCQKVFVHETQKNDALEIIQSAAIENGSSFDVVPVCEFVQGFENESFQSILPKFMLENAYFAQQVGDHWLEKYLSINNNSNEGKVEGFKKLLDFSSGKLLGRCQKIEPYDLYLDGAHTIESLDKCIDWFANLILSDKENILNSNNKHKILIFNITGGRNSKEFLKFIASHKNFQQTFTEIIFCSNVTFKTGNFSQENDNKTVSLVDRMCKIYGHQKMWQELCSQHIIDGNDALPKSKVFESIEEAIDNLDLVNSQVLVTGSLHLVSGVLQVVESLHEKRKKKK